MTENKTPKKKPSKKETTIKVSKKNPTLNYPRDAHRFFCRRCINHNGGKCPITNKRPAKSCKL